MNAPGDAVLLTNIAELVTNVAEAGSAESPDIAALGILADAALVMVGEEVVWVGHAAAAPAADRAIDCAGASVIPGFVDSHAHLVFAGDRSAEFAARMAGRPYAAGGIRTTVSATRAASDAALRTNTARLVAELIRQGSTTFEIKSGYGLTVDDEVRSLRIAGEFTDQTTFLGAHVVPPEYVDDRAGYLDLLAGPMVRACAPHAAWADVFCDRGAFDGEEARAILDAAAAAGLPARVHANQLEPGPGVQVAVQVDAASADHCTHLTDLDIDALAGSRTVATLLPGAEFSTRSPYPDARRLLAAGVTVALATDCNPGTSYTTSMPLCLALAVREMNMTVAQALWAATAGGAAALRQPGVGRIAPGAPANVVVLAAPSYVHLAYRPGVDLIGQVWRGGRLVHAGGGHAG